MEPNDTDVNESKDRNELTWPLDVQTLQILARASDLYLPDRILDLFFNNIFRYLTLFESLDGVTTSGTAAVDGVKLTLTTGGTSGNSAEASKTPLYQNLLSFGYKSRFRTALQFTSITNHTTYIVAGSLSGGTYYGFKLVGDGSSTKLYGVTKDGSTEQTVLLKSGLSADTTYSLEARYTPKNGVIFYVDTSGMAFGFLNLGTITTHLPSYLLANTDKLYDVKVTTNTNSAKIMKVSYFEYVQFIADSPAGKKPL